jgi:hypothetical protein
VTATNAVLEYIRANPGTRFHDLRNAPELHEHDDVTLSTALHGLYKSARLERAGKGGRADPFRYAAPGTPIPNRPRIKRDSCANAVLDFVAHRPNCTARDALQSERFAQWEYTNILQAFTSLARIGTLEREKVGRGRFRYRVPGLEVNP